MLKKIFTWIKKELVFRIDLNFDKGPMDLEVEIGWIWVAPMIVIFYPSFRQGVIDIFHLFV